MDQTDNLSWLSSPIAKHTNKVCWLVIFGLVVVTILGGFASFNPSIAVISSLLFFLLVLVYPRPILIVYGLTLALPLTGGLARGAVIPFLRISQALLVLGFMLVVVARPSRLGKFRLTAIDLAFFIYVLSEAVFPMLALYYRGGSVNLTSIDPLYGQSTLQSLLGPIQYYVLYRVVVALISSEQQVVTTLKLTFISSILVSIIGILQELVPAVNRFIQTYYPPVGDTYQRITSTLQHYSGLGAYLAFVLILALACYMTQPRIKIPLPLLGSTFIFDSIALVLTGTFAAWIGLAVGMVVIFVMLRRIPKPAIYMAIGVVLAAIIFQPFLSARLSGELGAGSAQGLLPQSFAFRIMLWKDFFIPAIGQNLLFGAGPSPAILNQWPAEESEYFLTLLRGGLFYFFAYLFLIGLAGFVCWRQIKRKASDAAKVVSLALFAILISLSVMDISGEYFTYVGGTQIIWTLLAIVVATWQQKELESGTRRSLPDTQRTALESDVHDRLVLNRHLESRAFSENGYDNSEAFPYQSLIPDYTWPSVYQTEWTDQRFGKVKRLLDWHFVKDSVLVGAGSTIARILGLIFSTVLARYLVPDDFGFFRYAVTLAGIVTIAVSTSPNSIARFLAANPDDEDARDRYFTNGIFGIALLLMITLLVSVPLLGVLHALNIGTFCCIIGLAGFYLYLAIARGLNSAWKMSLTYIINNVALVAALIVVFGLFKLHSAMVAITIWGLANLVPLLMELFRPIPLRFRRRLLSKRILLDMARFAFPMVISSGAFAIWYGIDLLIVENLYPHAAGSYAAAKTLGQLYIFVPSAITLVLMPRVASANLSKSLRYLAGGVLIALLVSLAGFAIVDIWGQKVISLVFGQNYINAYQPLVILSIGMCIVSINTVLEGFLIGRGQPSKAAQAMIVAMISTGLLGFLFIPRLGAVGGSLAFTIGAGLATIVMQVKTYQFLRDEVQNQRAPAPALHRYVDVTDPALSAITLKHSGQRNKNKDT
jgi:stage V sporulation protein B